MVVSRLPAWVGPVFDHLDGYDVKRGFLRWVEIDPVVFMALAHALFAEQPIEAVELAGKQPAVSEASGMAYWYRAGSRGQETAYDLPAELMGELTGDPTATMSISSFVVLRNTAISRSIWALKPPHRPRSEVKTTSRMRPDIFSFFLASSGWSPGSETLAISRTALQAASA